MLNKNKSDISKGIALLFVVVSHIPRIFPSYNLSFLNPLGFIGVGIFLFLSGYGLECSYQKSGLNSFWKKRLLRIIPGVLITTIIISCLQLIIRSNVPFSIPEFILSCVGLSNKVNSVTWYIGMIWFCYIFFWISKKTKLKVVYLCVLLPLIILLVSFIFKNTPINMWGLNAFGFGFGMISTNERTTKYIFDNKIVIIFSCLMFLGLFYLYYIALGNPENIYFRNPIKSFLSILFCIGFIAILRMLPNMRWLEKTVGWIGKISYEAFLIHAPFIFIFPEFFRIANTTIMIIVFGVSTFALSWLLHLCLAKIIHIGDNKNDLFRCSIKKRTDRK